MDVAACRSEGVGAGARVAPRGQPFLFGLWAVVPGQDVPMAFLFFPLIGYAGLRFGPAGAATLVALVAAFSLPIAALGLGPFTSFPARASRSSFCSHF